MKENLRRKNNGITLIALIITIIILLILAMVSIKLIINGGLISKTQDAVLISKIAEIEEKLKLQITEDQIIKSSEEPIYESDGNGSVPIWNTPYINSLYLMLRQELYPSVNGEMGLIEKNLYDTKTGKEIAKNLIWLPTDVINDKNGHLNEMFYGFNIEHLDIKLDIGENGYYIKLAETEQLSETNLFYFDEDYNVYYIDKDGNIYTSKRKYTKDEIYFGEKYFNPDTLPEADKKAYYGIYEGALAFSGDEEYAKQVALADADPNIDTVLFAMGGYSWENITTADGEIMELGGKTLTKLVMMLYTPDGKVGDLSGDIFYYMDSEYNMYELNTNTNILKDSKGNTLEIHDIQGIPNNSETYSKNGYTIYKRFDNKNEAVGGVPDQEVIDMNKDLAGLNIFTILNLELENKSNVKRLILPDTMKTLECTSVQRNMNDDSIIFSGKFEGSKNLEYIEIPNNVELIYAKMFKDCTNLKEVIMPDNIKRIGENAFKGCSNVTLKFKNRIAPYGSPWGGINIKIEKK